jgi:hypothetical protein
MGVIGARRKIAILTTLMATLGLSLTALPASAQTIPGCVLTIDPVVGTELYKVHVDCGILAPHPYELYGDENVFYPPQFILASSQPVIYVHRSVLNEDVEGRDEIFAMTLYVSSTGAVTRKRTNTVTGNF